MNKQGTKNYLFWEEWNADHELIRVCEKTQHTQLLIGTRADMTVNTVEWERNNPQPPMRRDTFIRQLHERILALEAALAEKGGAR